MSDGEEGGAAREGSSSSTEEAPEPTTARLGRWLGLVGRAGRDESGSGCNRGGGGNDDGLLRVVVRVELSEVVEREIKDDLRWGGRSTDGGRFGLPRATTIGQRQALELGG